MSATKTRRMQRSRAIRLDPYAVDEVTLTLDQWRRLQQPTPEVGRPRTKPRSHRRAA